MSEIDLMDEANRIKDYRYDRVERIGWWNQACLNESRVLVVGAGAIGNEVLKNLALLGVGTIVVLDMDKIEGSNLSRCVLFRESDRGKGKAEIAASRVQELNPSVKCISFDCDVVWGVGQGLFRRMDVVVGAVDNRLARYYVNRCCSMFAVPYVDAGMQELRGSVSAFKSSETACYECTLYDVDYQLLTDKYPCLGFIADEIVEGKAPTTPTTSSIISGIQTQEIVKILHLAKGHRLPASADTLLGKEFRYDGHRLRGEAYSIPRKERCLNEYCGKPIAASDIIQLDFTRNRTIGEFQDEVSKRVGNAYSVNLGGVELLTRAKCPSCNNSLEFFIPQKSIKVSEMICKNCGSMLVAETTRFLPKEERTLKEINIPPAFVFGVASDKGTSYVELSGDLSSDPVLRALDIV